MATLWNKTIARSFVVGVCVLSTGLSACASIDKSHYASRGLPQSLLDKSNERVTFGLTDVRVLEDMAEWINNDQPTDAELNCSGQDPLCEQAEMALHQFGVPYEINAGFAQGNEVVLNYERLVTRDCTPRFQTESTNVYNLNHENFGCATASNIVQMVSDQRQFVSPAYQDPKDAEGAVKAFDSYLSE